ncbi:bifunctional DNA primase/polymerase, partial [Catellatospora sp. KI3]|uniref:bifunctional DNA primase/polymerase n=1 Tax=Catellatospora sp. KI3 TaxID=3041620 RepID=UPI002482C5D4
YNIGLACGPSGLAVVDLDVLKPGRELHDPWADYTHGADVLDTLMDQAGAVMARTRTVTTPSGGLHLYYRHPSGPQLRNTAGRLGPLVDSRAHGGYVVAAGSVIDGVPYAVCVDLVPV